MKKNGLVLSTVLFASLAHAGGISSGGGDSAKTPFEVFAWFYDQSRTIKACIEVAPNFGLTEAEIAPQLAKAFTTWKIYIGQKRINEKNGMFGGKLQFTTNVTYLDSCNGQEDLAFYFGVENADVKDAKKLYNEPVAFAVLKEFDRQKAWGKGFVWVAAEKSLNSSYPNWQFRDNILTILLHEIGHVYGNSHVAGTIMTEHIMSLLAQEVSTTVKTSIDIYRELFQCSECTTVLKGYAVTNANGSVNATHRLLTKILSHPFSGMTRVTLSKNQQGKNCNLVVNDEDKKTTDLFEINITGERVVDGPYVFSNVWLGWSTSVGRLYYGYLTNKKGEKVNMVLESNLVDYSQSMPEFSTLMKVNGFVDGEFAELVTYRIQHQLN